MRGQADACRDGEGAGAAGTRGTGTAGLAPPVRHARTAARKEVRAVGSRVPRAGADICASGASAQGSAAVPVVHGRARRTSPSATRR